MEQTFIEKFQEAILANTDTIEFVMQFEEHYYYCYWTKAKWQYRRIDLIGTDPNGE